MNHRVRVLIADDHEVVRHGLRSLLEAEPHLQVVAEASSGREAVERARDCKPQIAVLDISMPELNGLEAARQILREQPAVEVLILTMHDSEQLVRETLEAGARGYVLKSDAARDLVAAVNALHRHTPFFTSRVASMVLEGYLKRGPATEEAAAPGAAVLTPREREVVQLLAEGKSNKEVATTLGISVKTAETHRSHVMHKLGIRSLGELVRYAVRNGMVAP